MSTQPDPAAEAAPRRAAVYVRISKARVDVNGTKSEEGILRQEELCRERAKELGWDVVEVYADNDIEASSGKPRPAYDRMVEDMRHGRINAVVGWHSDRIYRRPDELETLIRIAEANDVLFSAVRVGNIDLSTASGRLVARLLGAAAKYETELKGERQKAQLRQRALAGLPPGGGTRPFGYEPGWVALRHEEAAVIRTLADRALTGQSVNSLTAMLHDQQVPTVRGGPWHANVVQRLLTNPRIAGLSVWEGQVVAKAQWPAILSEEEHRRLVAILEGRGQQEKRTRARVALLPGMIWCGRCGYALVTFTQARVAKDVTNGKKWDHVRSYGCRTDKLPGNPGYRKACGSMSVKAKSVEDDVVERLLARLARPASARLLARGDSGPVADQQAIRDIGALEQRLVELGVDYADELIGRTEFIAARDRIAARMKYLEKGLAGPKLNVPAGNLESLVEWWETAELGVRRILVGQYVDRVAVHPHSGQRSTYNPARVHVEWR